MSEQVLIQFRADRQLKQEVSEIYESLGMDLPTAFRMFMSMSKMVGGIPFSVTIPKAQDEARASAVFDRMRTQAQRTPEMTLDEINAEIVSARAEKNR
ncbi:MAG: type II toxin-antitoxin system RelB/DinJ family antitoxin [Clostridia bacterium]|nr:type II toxin-antitoxin system RelB/DinJ family antitoxin [Clostridia bacterium]